MFERKISDIPGYENIQDYYFITRMGKVISMKNNIPHILADRLSSNGYYCIQLMTKEAKTKQELISRLVASAFIPNNNPNKIVVHHKDHNKLNNNFNNLMWVTYEQNIRYSILEKNYIPGQISMFNNSAKKKYIIINKVNKTKKIHQNQLSIADIC